MVEVRRVSDTVMTLVVFEKAVLRLICVYVFVLVMLHKMDEVW